MMNGSADGGGCGILRRAKSTCAATIKNAIGLDAPGNVGHREPNNNGVYQCLKKQLRKESEKSSSNNSASTPDQVTPEAKFIEDLGADSLDTVELVMALEEEFGNEIPDEQAEKLQSVGDVIKYIEDTQKK